MLLLTALTPFCSTHIRAAMLPPALQTTGRLVVIGRNPKDALVSRFFWERRGSEDEEESAEEQRRAMETTHREFLEEVAEGEIPTGAQYATHPSSHPPPPTPPTALCPALYPRLRLSAAPCSGDYWSYYRDLAALVSTIGPDRALLTFYETLQTDFHSEVRRLGKSNT